MCIKVPSLCLCTSRWLLPQDYYSKCSDSIYSKTKYVTFFLPLASGETVRITLPYPGNPGLPGFKGIQGMFTDRILGFN